MSILPTIILAVAGFYLLGLIVLLVAALRTNLRECNHCEQIFEATDDGWLCPACKEEQARLVEVDRELAQCL